MKLILFVAVFSVCLSCNNSESKNEKKTTTESPTTELPKTGNDKEAVEEVLNKYKEYTAKEDYEKMVSFSSPSLLKGITKEELVKGLRDGMHNENYDIIIDELSYDDISDVIEKDGSKFALAKTRTKASFKLKKDNLFDSFCKQFNDQYKDVKCDKSTNTISFEMKGEIYPVYTKEDKKWFILSDSDPKGIKEIIPEDIRTKLGIKVSEEE